MVSTRVGRSVGMAMRAGVALAFLAAVPSAGALHGAFRMTRRSCVCGVGGLFASTMPTCASSDAAPTEVFTFTEKSLGLELAQQADGRVRIERVKPDSPAIAKGVPPLATVVEVNGVSTAGLDVQRVQALVRSSPRPLSLRLDASAFRALPPTQQTEAAAAALGMATESINIKLLTGPQARHHPGTPLSIRPITSGSPVPCLLTRRWRWLETARHRTQHAPSRHAKAIRLRWSTARRLRQRARSLTRARNARAVRMPSALAVAAAARAASKWARTKCV